MGIFARPLTPALRRRKIRVLVGVLIVAAVIIYLVLANLGGAQIYYLTIAELRRGDYPPGQNVRVSAAVDGASIRWDADKMLLQFTLVEGLERLEVVYRGVRPDMLRDEATAVVEGRLGDDGLFQARDLLLKCPSKYEAAATATAAR